MNSYIVKTPYNHHQKHIVIAETMCQAEKAFLEKYGWSTKIDCIELDAEYVLLARDILKENE